MKPLWILLALAVALLPACSGETPTASPDGPAAEMPPAATADAETHSDPPAHDADGSAAGNHSDGATKESHSDDDSNHSSPETTDMSPEIVLGSPGEFDLVPVGDAVASGTQTFAITNSGAVEHEVIFIRTDLDSGALPSDGKGGASEEGAVVPHGSGHGDGVQAGHVGTHIAAGESGSLKVDLEPGRYAVICNLPGHYAQGMHANIEVKG